MSYYAPRLAFVAVALPVWLIFGFWGSITMLVLGLIALEAVAYLRGAKPRA